MQMKKSSLRTSLVIMMLTEVLFNPESFEGNAFLPLAISFSHFTVAAMKMP